MLLSKLIKCIDIKSAKVPIIKKLLKVILALKFFGFSDLHKTAVLFAQNFLTCLHGAGRITVNEEDTYVAKWC